MMNTVQNITFCIALISIQLALPVISISTPHRHSDVKSNLTPESQLDVPQHMSSFNWLHSWVQSLRHLYNNCMCIYLFSNI